MRAIWALPALIGAIAPAQNAPGPCTADLRPLVADAVFARYPAARVARFRPVPPDVRRGDAHAYRTRIREAAAERPNFAGHYTIVQIGCGAGTACLALLDARNGRVRLEPMLRSASAYGFDAQYELFNFRRNSRLLVVLGAPNEDLGRSGASYYELRDGALRLFRFVPRAQICAP